MHLPKVHYLYLLEKDIYWMYYYHYQNADLWSYVLNAYYLTNQEQTF